MSCPIRFKQRHEAQKLLIAKLQKQLRAEMILTNALQNLVYLPSKQSPNALRRVRRALERRAA